MKQLSLRYRVPTIDGCPVPGSIIMGIGPRVRRAYRVLSIARTRSSRPGLGVTTWRVYYEAMSAERGRNEIEAGCPYWPIYWDKRSRKAA